MKRKCHMLESFGARAGVVFALRAGVVAFVAVFSGATGLLRQVMLGAALGSGARLDGFVVSFSAIQILTGVVDVAVSGAVVLIGSEFREAGEANRYFMDVIGWSIFCGIAMGVATFFGAGRIIEVLGPGLTSTGHVYGASVLRAAAPGVALGTVASAVAGVRQVNEEFISTTAMFVPRNVLTAVAAGVGLGATGVGAAISVGAAAQVLVVGRADLIQLVRRATFRWSHDMARTARRLPILCAQYGTAQLAGIVDRVFASGFAAGTISELSAALLFVAFLGNVSAAGVNTLLPRFAKAQAGTSGDNVRSLWIAGSILTAVVCFVESMGLTWFSENVIGAVFSHGHWSSDATLASASFLRLLGLSLVFGGVGGVSAKALLGMGENRRVLTVILIYAVMNIAGDVVFIDWMGVYGIAAANVVSSVGYCASAWFLARRAIGQRRQVDVPAHML